LQHRTDRERSPTTAVYPQSAGLIGSCTGRLPFAAPEVPLSASAWRRGASRRKTKPMFYRVDYNVALVLAGAIAAALASRRLAALAPERLARGYLALTAAIVALRVGLFVTLWSLGVHGVQPVAALVSDAGFALVGVIYGLAIISLVRGGFGDFLRAGQTRFALALSTAATFALAGIGKTFGLDDMLAFFAQSGYSKSFLFFILTIEVLGAMALLLPWRWVVVAAIAGLTVDMVGAIATHVHNGDPLDDSAGAVAALLRLAPLALLCVPRAWTMTGAAVCTAFALLGAVWLRHAPAPPPVRTDELAYFVGPWHCAGQFTRTGKPIEADLRGELAADDRWLILHHDDRPPGPFHAIGTWFHDRTGWIANLADSTGGVRRFRADGWHGNELTWDHTGTDVIDERFVYRRLDDASFEVAYDRHAADAWQRVDALTCRRGASG
jgi:hypothetical protein